MTVRLHRNEVRIEENLIRRLGRRPSKPISSTAQIPSRPTLAVECRHCPARVKGLGALR
jgi:hypothetical protein